MRIPALILVSFLTFSRTLFGETAPPSPGNALEHRTIEALAAGLEPEIGQLGAALVASGVHQAAELQGLLARWETIAEPLLALRATNDTERARLLLEGLHRAALRRYREERTSISDVFANGDFNCVTSTVLYLELARRAGFTAQAVLIPEHVYAEVRIDERWIEVETTNPRGFDPYRSRPSGAPASPQRFLIPDQAPGKPRLRLPAERLPGLLYYNRGTLAMKRKDYRTALVLLGHARLILPDHAPNTENLLAAFLARAEELARTATLEEALAMIRQGEAILGRRAEFTTLAVHAHHLAVRKAKDAGRHDEALRLARALLAAHPDNDGSGMALLRACHAELAENHLQAGRYPEMRETLEQGAGENEPADYRRFRISQMTRAAEALINGENPERGLVFFEVAFPEDNGDPRLVESRSYLIVRLAERRKRGGEYESAYRTIRTGLERYPEHRVLLAAKTALIHEWAASLAPSDAAAILSGLATRHDEPVFLQALARTVLLEADRLLQASRHEEAISLLENLLRLPALPAAEAQTARTMRGTAIHNRAVVLLRAAAYEQAILFLEEALRTDPGNRDLENLLAGAFYNFGLQLFQGGKQPQARMMVAKGLARFPNDRPLLRLKNALDGD